MGAKVNERKNINYYSMKAKTSDSDATPYIGKSTKVGDKWQVTEKFNAIDGHLTDIRHSTYKSPESQEEKTKVELTLMDEDGTTNILGANFNNMTYAMLNLLASQEEIGKLDINIWLGKPDKATGKAWPSIAIKNAPTGKQDWEQCKWKYDYKDTPKADKVVVGKKTVTDDSKVVEFWTKVIDEQIKPKLKAFTPAPQVAAPAPEAIAPATEAQAGAVVVPDDDLPF